jgi:hypothetical protein
MTSALITVYVTYRLSERSKERDRDDAERSRQYALYAVVFPERVKAVTTLMSDAATAYATAVKCSYVSTGEERRDQLGAELRALESKAQSYGLLLGQEVEAAAAKFRRTCSITYCGSSAIPRPKPFLDGSDTYVHEADYQALMHTLQKSIHLEMFDMLWRPTKT